MRRVWWLVAAIVLLAAGAAEAEVALGQATTLSHPMLSVTGNGMVQVAPDTVRVAASVITEASTVAEARDANAAIATKALAALTALKIPNLMGKTADYTMERVTRDVSFYSAVDPAKLDIPWRNIQVTAGPNNNMNLSFPITLGYKASNSVTVRVQNLPREELASAASKIVDTLMAAGCNQITSVTYSLETESNEAQREALAKAMQDAQLTAETVAKAAGRTIVGIRSISPSYYRGDYAARNVVYAQAAFASGGGGGGGYSGPTPFTAGLLQVTAQVQVMYDLNFNAGDTQVVIGK